MLPNCEKCGKQIPAERVEACLELYGTIPTVCTACSNIKKHFSVQVFGHKTGGEAFIIPNATQEQIRQAKRFYRRAR